MLLHTENSLLTLLEGEPGVIQKHATFTDIAFQVIEGQEGCSLCYFELGVIHSYYINVKILEMKKINALHKVL